VVEATSADAAWTYLLAGASVDVIFIDIRMPGSMDGVELALRAKDEYPDIPVILTSGASPPPSVDDHRFIGKPYDVSYVASVLADYLL